MKYKTLIFKSQENIFINTFDQKEFRNLNGFTILTILDKFFYTDPNSRVTYISNVIVDKSESISFSVWKTKKVYFENMNLFLTNLKNFVMSENNK